MMKLKTCKGCHWMIKNPDALNAFMCIGGPPTAYPMIDGRGNIIGIGAFRPPIAETNFACSLYTTQSPFPADPVETDA
jgi:hypothetical protein